MRGNIMTVSQRVTRSISGLFIGMGLSLSLGACGQGDSSQRAGSKPEVTITLVGYAVPKAEIGRASCRERV